MNRLDVPRLHLVGPLDGVSTPARYPAIVAAAVSGGVDAAHVRLPGAPGGDTLDLASDVQSRISAASSARLIVNDRIDVAMIVGAYGVHLGERSVSVADARSVLDPGVCIGRSIHELKGATEAEADGADYIIAGHVFGTDSKRGQPGRGLQWLSEVVRAVSVPVIAIGGIRADRVEDVLSAGAWGVAVGREILSASDPAVAARQIRSKVEGK